MRDGVTVYVRGRGPWKSHKAKKDSFDNTLHHINEVGYTSAQAEGKWFSSFYNMQAYKEKQQNKLCFEVEDDDSEYDVDSGDELVQRVVGAVFI